MGINIRDYVNSFKTADFVDGITQIPVQYGYINSQSLFDVYSTPQTAIIFDKDYSTTTLLPQVARGSKASTNGKGQKADTFALQLAYFKHDDRLTGDDIQSQRIVGRTESDTIARAMGYKMTKLRLALDQSSEYMKLQALKGVFKTPDGTVMADMFTEFGVTQTSIDFVLGNSTTNIDQKLRLLKTAVWKGLQNGGALSGTEVLVDPSFFDKLVSHNNMKTAYQFYMNSGKQLLRDDLSNYTKYGIMDSFEFRGVNFLSYDATFNLPNGTTETAFATDNGTAYAKGAQDLFRTYFGPSNKLSGANQGGQEVFVRTYVDPRDEYMEIELESAPLHFCTRPASLVKVLTSN